MLDVLGLEQQLVASLEREIRLYARERRRLSTLWPSRAHSRNPTLSRQRESWRRQKRGRERESNFAVLVRAAAAAAVHLGRRLERQTLCEDEAAAEAQRRRSHDDRWAD